jgi:hypothetical protein
MSRRRREPPDPDESVLDDPEPDPDEPEPEDEEVEYFVEPDELEVSRTSVPNSAQSAHTWSSAPSIFTVLGAPVSVPHISHWTMDALWQAHA